MARGQQAVSLAVPVRDDSRCTMHGSCSRVVWSVDWTWDGSIPAPSEPDSHGCRLLPAPLPAGWISLGPRPQETRTESPTPRIICTGVPAQQRPQKLERRAVGGGPAGAGIHENVARKVPAMLGPCRFQAFAVLVLVWIHSCGPAVYVVVAGGGGAYPKPIRHERRRAGS